MRPPLVEVADTTTRLRGRAALASARHRFALAGFALAIAGGFGAPLIAQALGAPLEVALALCLAVGFVALGWVLGRRVDVLVESSFEDPVTRIGNRRFWEGRLELEIERSLSSRMPLSVLFIDIDNLKTMNDAHGHATGDRALSVLGDVLRETCRSRDVAARIGGDEFAVLLPRTRASEAKVVADRLRASLARRRSAAGAPLDGLLTVSMGIADLDCIREPRAELLARAADDALYAAKQGGRDRVEVAPRVGAQQCASGVICLDERRRAKANKGRPVSA